jgi:hypothetical protein
VDVADGPRLRVDPLGLWNWQMTQKTAHPCQPAAQASQPSLSTMAGFAGGAPIRASIGYVGDLVVTSVPRGSVWSITISDVAAARNVAA